MVAKSESNSVLRGTEKPEPLGRGSDDRSAHATCIFAGFRLENDGTLWRGDTVVHLPPRELSALRLLMAHAGQVVSPMQLKNELWGDVHVTADSVPKCMSSLRTRLEPDACIQTVYKRGYRFVAEIKRAGAPAKADAPVRLAIVPFATGYTVPEHLGPAIAEEATATLSRTRQFAVAVLARDSVFNLAHRGLSAQQIGEELKADLVLTGTLLAFASQYRLRAEMIQVEDGTQIWVEDLLAPRGHTGELQSELMRRLAYRLGAEIEDDAEFTARELYAEGQTHNSPPPRRSQNGIEISAAAVTEIDDEFAPRQTEAYDAFLRGHYEWQTLHRHHMQDALQRLLQAVELDPTLTSAKIDLARLCVSQALYGFMSPSASAELVHRVAESIPDLPHQAAALLPELGWVNFHYDRNLAAAILAFSFSSQLPHDLSVTRARAMFAVSRQRYTEAIQLLDAAILIDPFSPWLQAQLAWVYHLKGLWANSLQQIRKTLVQFPDHEGACLFGAMIFAFNGEAEQGIELAHGLAQRSPYFDLANAAHAYALACAGRTDEARSVLERLQWLGRERYVMRGLTPAAYLALGDQEAALAELRTANEARCPWFFQTLDDPRLQPLHGNPEFERLRAVLPGMEADVEQDLEMED